MHFPKRPVSYCKRRALQIQLLAFDNVSDSGTAASVQVLRLVASLTADGLPRTRAADLERLLRRLNLHQSICKLLHMELLEELLFLLLRSRSISRP